MVSRDQVAGGVAEFAVLGRGCERWLCRLAVDIETLLALSQRPKCHAGFVSWMESKFGWSSGLHKRPVLAMADPSIMVLAR
jgi:hypothetical protein